MDNLNKKYLVQSFQEKNVKLEITSFKTMECWMEHRETFELNDIWKFINWIVPIELFNIHNFNLIKSRFATLPSNKRIFDLLQSSTQYSVSVHVDLHNPFKGCHIVISDADKSIINNSKPDTFILRNEKHQYIVQDYIDPNKDKTISLLNQFSFYEIFNKYVSLGNTNNGKRTFMVVDDKGTVTDKQAIAFKRQVVWRGATFENSFPVRDRSRNLYHRIEDSLKELVKSESFFDVFRSFTALVSNYATSANSNATRINRALNFIPSPHTQADNTMRDMRRFTARLSLRADGFDPVFIPYLEIGKNPYDFTFGVITR